MKIKRSALLIAFLLVISLHFVHSGSQKQPSWSSEVEQALGRAGKNRPELEKALTAAPAEQRAGMTFLIANMPERDLQSLQADFLLDNVSLAYQARKQVPWGRRLPEDIFLNEVLPYANVDEMRSPWRQWLFDLCLPLIKECRTPAEAAQRLNSTVFPKLKVRYSTERKKANQDPRETVDSGKATCTGLTILLVDACRSVAIPARLVGTPLWANERGNHTWVEVWDDGWHFTGAAEPDPRGLDHAWFEHDASQATKDSRLHAIYAASFRRTEVIFPLVWDETQKEVYAENVTDRYARVEPTDDTRTHVQIRVRLADSHKRLALPVTIIDRQDPNQELHGESRGEEADTNDILTFKVARSHDYLLRLDQPVSLEKPFRTTAGEQQLVEVEVQVPQTKEPAPISGISAEQVNQLEKAARAFFTAPSEQQAQWQFDAALDQQLAAHEAALRQLVWKVYQAAPIHAHLMKDFERNEVSYREARSPYTVRKVGNKPAQGWPLFIALHGGGGASKEVNDSQWKIMQHYYRDQPSVAGYQYLALRAPNDTWNGFYDDTIPPLITNLIRQFVLFGEVDPDKVFLMGYSHGGYGAFFIGPKIPDRFAAIHSSAAAPTDGAISPATLRNTRFTSMVGDQDNAYGRRQRCEAFNEAIQKLKEKEQDDYPVVMELKKGFGHGGLPDRDKIKEMYSFTRNPMPRHLTWELTDAVITQFYWLSVPNPSKDQALDATIHDNTVRVTTRQVKHFALNLDGRLVAFDKPLHVSVDGKDQVIQAHPRFLTLCQSMLERGDPELAYTYQLRLEPEKK